MKILVVDDEKDVLFAVSALLNSLGYSVDTASSGKEGLEKMRMNNFDVVFLDIKMPEMDGIEVLKKIKDRNIDVIPIILTAYGELHTAIEAVKYGAYDFLEKPVTREMLKFAVERAKKRKEIEEKILRYREYEYFYNIWHSLIKIHEFKPLLEEIPKVLYDAFENKFKIYLILLLPFEEIFSFPPETEYDIGSLKEILEEPKKIGEEGITKISKIENKQILTRYYKPEDNLFFIFALENEEKIKEDIIKKFEFLSDEISTLVTKNYLSHRLNEALTKLRNIHLHSIKTGTLSLLVELGSEFFKNIISPLEMAEKEMEILKERTKDVPVSSLIASIESKLNELKNTFEILRSITGLEKFQTEKVNVDEIIQIAYSVVSDRMKSLDITFERIGEENLKIIANPSAIESALVHILLNSIDAMPLGGKIIIETEKKDDNVIIRVIDNGEGIDSDIMERIFEPFFTTKREKGGTGLGLTSAKWLVEKMGGKIEIESKKGLGTKVSIYLKSA